MRVRHGSAAVFGVFAAYGALWGPYLALMPEVRRATGAGEAQYGAALLVGALATLPTMFVAGRLVDRWGRRMVPIFMIGFAVLATAPPFAGSVPELFVAVTLFGCGSGACNVVAVALASAVEAGSGERIMNRAHALFPVGLLTCSLLTGAVRTAGISAEVVVVGFNSAVAASVLLWGRTALPVSFAPAGRSRDGRRGGWRGLGRAALPFCALAALALVVESGVQQWSAVFLTDVVRAPVGLSAAAPGVFAAAMALGRFGGHWLSGRASDRTVLLASGGLAAFGVLALAAAGGPASALAATAMVGAAISVAPPTAYGLIGRGAAPENRGAVLGSSTSLASIGLLLGPALVGWFAAWLDLRTAIAGLALVAFVVSLLALNVPSRSEHP
ncbi:MFS transporter [Actinomadura kijaniata]